MIDRDFILKRISSRVMTQEEFNYEYLSAPPISSMFSQQDIQELHYIISSAQYASKLKEKYALIDNIMGNRGFRKLISGTNRVSYEPVFDNSFIIKVPYTSVAFEDNIREYQNQFLIKPFCTKVFESTPCGTIGVFERVRPITHTMEFLSIADEIYKLLSEFLIGEYVLDDIGTKYFMNYGVRTGFGPVLLDFPYVYKVDPKKLICSAIDENNITGYCNGELAYDDGFNEIHCSKCGCKYKPHELGKKFEWKPTLLKGGYSNMKIKVSGGSLNIKPMQEKVTGEFRNPVKAIASEMLNKRVEELKKEEEEIAKKTVNGASAPKEEVKEEKKEVKSPFSIDEDKVGSKEDEGFIEDKKDIGKLMADINHLYFYSSTSDEDKEKIVKTIKEYIADILAENIDIAMQLFADVIRKKKNIKDEITQEFLNSTSCALKDQIIKLLFKNGEYVIEVNQVEDDLESVNIDITKSKNDQSVFSTIAENILDIPAPVEVDNEIEESEEISDPVEFKYCTGVSANQKDYFPDLDNKTIILVKDSDGNNIINDNCLIAITNLIGREVSDSVIVSKAWYQEMKNLKEQFKEAPVGSLSVEDKSSDVEEEEVTEEE